MQGADHDATRHAIWQTFERHLGSLAHPRRLAQVFDGLISDDVAMKLAAEERFQDRLSALVGARHGLSPGDPGARPADETAIRLALATSPQLDAWMVQFGAVYRARAIAGVIESTVVVALQQALGDDAYAAALEHRDLADPHAALPPADMLAATAQYDGLRCLAAWCTGQPQPVAGRIRLKLPPGDVLDGPPEALFERLGPSIVERVVSSGAQHG